jgi:hypothetical protein
MRYVAFTALGLLFAVTAAHITYSHLNGQQRWRAFCFTHLATASDCADRGYRRL